MQKKYTTEEKQEKFNAMVERIKELFGTELNPYPDSILDASRDVYYGMKAEKQDFIIQGLVKMIVSAVVEDKFYPIDFSYPMNEYFEDGEMNYTYFLEEFNTKLGDFLRNGRGIKVFLGTLASLTDPFEAVEEYLNQSN